VHIDAIGYRSVTRPRCTDRREGAIVAREHRPGIDML